MTKTELNKFKEFLEAKQTELARVLRNRDGIAIEKSPDALDEVQNAAERELAIRNLDRESNLLRNVRAALHRLDEGTLAFASTVRKTSALSAFMLCRGRLTASNVRRSPTRVRKK